ncbi:hypothetical protein K0M31_012489 [Melipona bicolor]|uniref:Uncharacterized protein n=1 Tax=Melipona bicolor TaxID=60889 RepID=A0AA40FK00_9HYME|nr:hypothetical protein K0M31_012489 [Melipona bicolor]
MQNSISPGRAAKELVDYPAIGRLIRASLKPGLPQNQPRISITSTAWKPERASGVLSTGFVKFNVAEPFVKSVDSLDCPGERELRFHIEFRSCPRSQVSLWHPPFNGDISRRRRS